MPFEVCRFQVCRIRYRNRLSNTSSQPCIISSNFSFLGHGTSNFAFCSSKAPSLRRLVWAGGQGATEWPVSLPNGHGQSRRRLKSSGFGLPLLLCGGHFPESRHQSLAPTTTHCTPVRSRQLPGGIPELSDRTSRHLQRNTRDFDIVIEYRGFPREFSIFFFIERRA